MASTKMKAKVAKAYGASIKSGTGTAIRKGTFPGTAAAAAKVKGIKSRGAGVRPGSKGRGGGGGSGNG